MTGTGVFLTDEEVVRVRSAASMPYIIVGGMAPQSPQQVVHNIALAKGLPEITGYYGANLKTKEIVTA